MSAPLCDDAIAQILSTPAPRLPEAQIRRAERHLRRLEVLMGRLSSCGGYLGRPALWRRHKTRLMRAFHLTRALPDPRGQGGAPGVAAL